MSTTCRRARLLIPLVAVAVCGLSFTVAFAEPGAGGGQAAGGAAERVVDFAREVRPILSDNCFACHGPDEAARQRGLRLDVREGLFEDRGRLGGPAVVAGNAADSRLYQRLVTGSSRLRMPRGADPLTDEQVETVRLWIDQGAEWETHWAFIPPERPALPPVSDPEWARNPIDRFVLARLDAAGLGPSDEADRATLLRRATLDLTGLPPAPGRAGGVPQRRFPGRLREGGGPASRLGALRRADGDRVAGRGPLRRHQRVPDRRRADDVALARLGDRRLQREHAVRPCSPSNSSRATCCPTRHGTSTSPPRSTAITARTAKGASSSTSSSSRYAVDRVETTSTVWLGLTLGCARCHDHKFDPISQQEFYEVLANFNNIPERGKAFKYVNSPPLITAPTVEQEEQLAELDEKLLAAREAFAALEADAAAAQAAWETSLHNAGRVDWTLRDDLLAHHALDGDIAGVHDGSFVSGVLEDGQPQFVDGRIGDAAAFDGQRFINAGLSPRRRLRRSVHPGRLDLPDVVERRHRVARRCGGPGRGRLGALPRGGQAPVQHVDPHPRRRRQRGDAGGRAARRVAARARHLRRFEDAGRHRHLRRRRVVGDEADARIWSATGCRSAIRCASVRAGRPSRASRGSSTTSGSTARP